MKRKLMFFSILIFFAFCISFSFAQVVEIEEGYQPLQVGDSGDEVTIIQEQLLYLGYYTGDVDGEFSEAVETAVLRFQQDYDLEQTGLVDGETETTLLNTEYRELTTGDSGDDVILIQEYLTALDYYNGKISGDYLEGTTYGIGLFQEKNGLESTGTADIETQRMLVSDSAVSRFASDDDTDDDTDGASNEIVVVSEEDDDSIYEFTGKIVRGDQGERVKLIQERLTELGFFDGPISGNYMNQTVEAVKAFQEKNSLDVDGITGAETWAALFESETTLDAAATPTPIPYALTVDITNQAVIAYGLDDEGEHTVAVRYMVCSTGTEDNPTPLGVFELTGRTARWAFFSLYGSYAQYWTLITEDIAFHSVIYNEVDLNSLSRKSYNRLGSRASHGCIRLLVHDAKWIYDNVGEGSLVTITDEIPEDAELQAALKPETLSSDYDYAPTTPEPTAEPEYSSTGMPPQPFRTLQRDSTGEDVYWLQMKLKELGYYEGAKATGTYLTGTVNAVKAFQEANGLTVDGIAGTETLEAIYADVLNPETATPVPETATPTPESTPASSDFTATPVSTETVSPTPTPSPTPSSDDEL